MDKLYQRIGEFVVCFQWMEHLIRQIGWRILDPNIKNFPPTELRDKSNNELLLEVEKLYMEFIEGLDIQDKEYRISRFRQFIDKCHQFRSFRNNLLHSAFIELKAGDEVINLVRSNPKLKKTDDGYYKFDSEVLEEESISLVMKDMAEVGFLLGVEYTQLIHWTASIDK